MSEDDLRREMRRLLELDAEADGYGLLDCIDNDGDRYQSAALHDCLTRLRLGLFAAA